MYPNRITLIKTLTEPGVMLDGRFEEFQVVNCNPTTGESNADGGALSVVFKATDISTGSNVAIKFFDPELPLHGAYRFDLFERESELLELLVEKNRCIQLVQPVKSFNLGVTDASGNSLIKDTYYYVVEWVEEDIVDYLVNQSNYSAEQKLQVFREIVLAVSALHNNGVYHRDLKRDNFRLATRGSLKQVVVIDLGTAAEFDSTSLIDPLKYMRPVGASGFAPIEANCRLAGVRQLGRHYDAYSMGNMLYGLFNVDYLYLKLVSDPAYNNFYGTCHGLMQISTAKNEVELIQDWHNVLTQTSKMFSMPDIYSAGSTVPSSLENILNKLFHSLVNVDYRNRLIETHEILRLIDTALLILRNSEMQRRILKIRKELRQNRIAKLARRQKKIEDYLQNQKFLGGDKC